MYKQPTILLLLLILAFPAFCQTQGCLHNSDLAEYRTLTQVTSTETIVREYILYVPANYDPQSTTPIPLVINMHGFGDCAADYFDAIGNFYNFNELADQENFIVVYPQGAWRPEKEDRYWEPGDPGVDHIYDNDVYFLEQLVSEVGTNFNLNMDKIFACGYSNGGMMAYSLACNSYDLFSGIGIMSGTMLEEDCDVMNPIPIIKFHGIADFVLPYNGDQWYQSAADVIDFWLDQNNISPNSLITTMINGGDVIREEYTGSEPNSCVTFYTVHEEWGDPGGHVWFSDQMDATNPNQIMWDFFNGGCAASTDVTIEPNPTLKIHPNPFSHQINITSNATSSQQFDIYNLQGVRLMSGTIDASPYSIDVSALPVSTYVLKVGGNVWKVVKME